MNSIQKELETNIERLGTDIPLAQKMSIVKDSRKQMKSAQKQVEICKKEINEYKPKAQDIKDISFVISSIETGIDQMKSTNIDESLVLFKDLMDKVEGLEQYINTEISQDEMVE